MYTGPEKKSRSNLRGLPISVNRKGKEVLFEYYLPRNVYYKE